MQAATYRLCTPAVYEPTHAAYHPNAMTQRWDFDRIELYLIRVLKTLIIEKSVSRAAMRLQSTQPAVSAQLKRLRALTGDPLLVRAGNTMAPTAVALHLLEPATRLLQDADRLFSLQADQRGFDARTSTATFRIAASDYLDPLFLPALVARVKRAAPGVRLELPGLPGCQILSGYPKNSSYAAPASAGGGVGRLIWPTIRRQM